jgi:hypothetical protein
MAYEDVLITPVYDWKHEIFAFTGQTWDSYDAIRKKYGIYTSSVKWPWRWHSMKKLIYQASEDEIDTAQYGPRSSYLDPASWVFPTDYSPPANDKVFYYDDTYQAMLAHVQANWDKAQVRAAFNKLPSELVKSKWHYFESKLTDLNYGAFAAAVSCDDTVGFFVPRYQISASWYYTASDDFYINIITDTQPLKRLYLVKVNGKGDLMWKPGGAKKVKSWWARLTSWIDNNNPIETQTPALSVKYYDFRAGQIAALKQWDSASTIERYQQICFINGWPKKDGRESPQMY